MSRAPRLVSAAAAALLLAGCATLLPDDRTAFSPAGQTLRVDAANGASSRMSFRQDGVVVASFGSQSVNGRWEMSGQDLCFNWGNAPRECWPLQGPFVRGRTQTITSTRGNRVQVTRL
ncbi:hypothetical protein [Sphingosinicella sp. YJ22]|uniref:hypothetical protein n=1 Tax=Sphingosinicella sp. YJ22 TaxID=1104780 RepID=UPI00140DEF7A|nr:hypothetical protein [Sphingosinicella sp. YJ22]